MKIAITTTIIILAEYTYITMHKNYELDKQVITNIICRHIKLTERQKQIKLIIYITEFEMSNLIVKNNTNSPKTFLNQINVVYKFSYPFQKCLSENNITANTFIGHKNNHTLSLPYILPL